MTPDLQSSLLRLALPKGRTHDAVLQLLRDARLRVEVGARAYRPQVSLPDVDTKILKPQTVVQMLQQGTRDLGFTGADWAAELGSDAESLVELIDTGLEPVRLVAAAPSALLKDGRLPDRRLTVATEFEHLTQRWIEARGIDAEIVRSFGATEVFPPEDADFIVDLASTGATLRANDLIVFDEVLRSSTRLYASRHAMAETAKRARIDDLVLLLRSVLDARRRVMLELNVDEDRLNAVVALLPCMREPTVARLASGGGFALRAAVPSDALPALIPALKSAGGTDLVVTKLAQIVA